MNEVLKLSRSAIESYMDCARCFVIQYKHKIRQMMLPFTLNSAVDNLAKILSDQYRELGQPHPIFQKHGVELVPFTHHKLDVWRSNFKGIRYTLSDHDIDFGGAIDDILLKPDGQLVITDVKSTSKNVFDWEDTWNKYEYPKAYKRQLEMYQWLFGMNGFDVANEAYLLYFNGLKNESDFAGQLNFESHIIRLDCDDSWVEAKIIEAAHTLRSDGLPESSSTCDTCSFLEKRYQVEQQYQSPF